jgi:hypothetical protein
MLRPNVDTGRTLQVFAGCKPRGSPICRVRRPASRSLRLALDWARQLESADGIMTLRISGVCYLFLPAIRRPSASGQSLP